MLIFSVIRPKSGGTVPPLHKVGGTRTPRTPVSYASVRENVCNCNMTSGSFEAKISIDIQQTSYFFYDFLRFFKRHFKEK